MEIIRLAVHLLIISGAINTGVLTSGNKALLFDCGDTITAERLAEQGITKIDKILCTQHRRVNISGAYDFVNKGANLIAPAGERHLFEKTSEYWHNPKNRWHTSHFQPGPQVLANPLKVDRVVEEGNIIEWEGYKIRVLDTPGATTGSVSYLVEIEGKKICFSGDVIYGPGQISDFYSLQKGYKTGDYHAFLGNLPNLKLSLEKLKNSGASVLIPSHGKIIKNPAEAVDLTIKNLDEAWKNYSSISTVRYYFPRAMTAGENDPTRMEPAPTHPEIDFLKRIPNTTTFVLKSSSGAAFIIDSGYDNITTSLRDLIKSREISSVDGVWITHYHYDHVDGLRSLYKTFDCPVITTDNMSEIIEYPRRFYLACISHNGIHVNKKAEHREKWQWREFTFTAFHFPGQTLYHSGLLAEGRGKKIFFAGDSFSPSGIDDYCAYNRNFLGKNVGFDNCIRLLIKIKPDAVINPHQDLGVAFTDKHYDYMLSVLAKREKIFSKILPWEHPNFGTDIWWARTYPYDQDIFKGNSGIIEVQFTNHSPNTSSASVEPVLPGGWTWNKKEGSRKLSIPPKKEGTKKISVSVPLNIAPGQYVIPIRINWNNRYLGPIRHAIIHVM